MNQNILDAATGTQHSGSIPTVLVILALVSGAAGWALAAGGILAGLAMLPIVGGTIWACAHAHLRALEAERHYGLVDGYDLGVVNVCAPETIEAQMARQTARTYAPGMRSALDLAAQGYVEREEFRRKLHSGELLRPIDEVAT